MSGHPRFRVSVETNGQMRFQVRSGIPRVQMDEATGEVEQVEAPWEDIIFSDDDAGKVSAEYDEEDDDFRLGSFVVPAPQPKFRRQLRMEFKLYKTGEGTLETADMPYPQTFK